MRPNQRAVYLGISILLLAIVPLGSTMLYTVDERELAVVLQFGQPVAERTEPGLYVKWPMIQEVRRLPKTYQFWEGSAAEERLVDVTTRDSKKIEATIWAVWRVTDPGDFVRSLRTVENAETRVKEFVRSTARDVLTRNDLAEIVRSTSRRMSLTLGLPELVAQGEGQADLEQQIAQAMAPEARQTIRRGRKTLTEEIRTDAQDALLQTRGPGGSDPEVGRGIALVDVGLSRVEFVPEVRDAAFERLIALMEAIAIKNRSEGEQRKQEITNQAQAEAEKIRGEGAEQSNILRGQVEAAIIEEYARAIEESGGFYDFNRTLELYKKAIGVPGTRMILGTENPLFQLLTDFDAASGDPSPPVDEPSSASGIASDANPPAFGGAVRP